jgi:fused signal recognition particle receptor
MEELEKIVRVVGRKCPGAPHESFLVLDATVGQNALQQGKTFAKAVALSGIVLAKLDSTAKGGAVLLVQRELGVPIRFVGVGESLEALEPFSASRFAQQLLAD